MTRHVPFIVGGVISALALAMLLTGKSIAPVVEPTPKQLPVYVPVQPPAPVEALRLPEKPKPFESRALHKPVNNPQPLSVNIFGPTKQSTADGPLRFSAVLTGDAARIKWRVRKIDVEVPIDSRGLTVTDSGRDCSFSGPSGYYMLGVAVASVDGDVDWWWHDFEITKDDVVVANTPPEQPAESPDQAMAPAQPQENLASYISNLVNQSEQSPTRNTDAVSVGGCFRSVSNLIQTGQYTGSDPMADVRRQAQLALGNTAANWEPFFVGVDALLANLRQRGIAATTENVGAILGTVGNVLASAH